MAGRTETMEIELFVEGLTGYLTKEEAIARKKAAILASTYQDTAPQTATFTFIHKRDLPHKKETPTEELVEEVKKQKTERHLKAV